MGRLSGLDYVRGVAALGVAVGHLTWPVSHLPELVQRIGPSAAAALGGHWNFLPIAWKLLPPSLYFVCCFFVLSGFVIELSLQRVELWRFFVRRALRIYPVLFLGIALALLSRAVFGIPEPSSEAVVREALLLEGYSLLPQAWTLLVEVRFYLIAAILMVCVPGIRMRTAIIALSFLGLAVLSVYRPALVNESVLSHSLGLSYWIAYMQLGTLMFHRHRGERAISTALVLHAIVFVLGLCIASQGSVGAGAGVVLESAPALCAGLITIAVVLALHDRLPEVRALSSLGAISYPLYVLHVPVGWLTFWATAGFIGADLAICAALAASIAVAAVVHHAVEQPFNRCGRYLTQMRAPRGAPA